MENKGSKKEEENYNMNDLTVEMDKMNLPSLLKEIHHLRNEVATLRSEVKAYETVEKLTGPNGIFSEDIDQKTGKSNVNDMKKMRRSILEDGTEINMRPSEMERMRHIFNLFDQKNTGFICATDLQELHRKLGEPISKEEADEAIKYFAPNEVEANKCNQNIKVNYTMFLKWWNQDHNMDDDDARKKRYQAKFKFLKARIANPDIGHFETESCGIFPSFEFRLKFFYNSRSTGLRTQVSPWHDIPLYNTDDSVNFVCEIPKWTRKKMEIATGEPYNPIKQDTKNGKLREYTWGDMMFNYGALPQTWEDPSHVTEGTGCGGDNDPIDVVEIGTKQWATGAIVQVKILGVLALIDSGETDWKVICINVEDHYASKINDVADVEAHMPGCISAIHDWLRDYKYPNVNQYGFDGKCMGREFAEKIVKGTHEHWKHLIKKRGGMTTV